MGESDVRQPAGQLHRASGPALDLVASKLLHPLTRPGTIHRSALIERLANGDPRRIVSLIAPPGYGKTTLLSQWAERNGQAFAWVSVDESDNDPKVLLSYVAEALDAVEPINGGCSTRSPPRELGARLGRPPAQLGLLVDDFTGRAGPG